MIKTLHKNNIHNNLYDFVQLIKAEPKLDQYVKKNRYGNLSIDFHSNDAVLMLNKALLKSYYNINWNIPKKYLCPPIPGRVDYIHYLADLVTDTTNIKVLDIGCGANCIYPLVGNSIHNWEFVGSDIDDTAILNAKKIIKDNNLEDKITIVKQLSKNEIFNNIINKDDKFTFTMCNPPFHKSKKEAKAGTKRKLQNLLKGKKRDNISLNFGGQHNELWCEGGELQFITKMIKESVYYKTNVIWFTSLVSKKENLPKLYKELEIVSVKEIKTIEMTQGNKITRFIAWRFDP
jgi:23S rRNA (adenine1618-N6)-methyltransferase